jgi:predicted lipoprotein with Yx(FWY)xxD motif
MMKKDRRHSAEVVDQGVALRWALLLLMAASLGATGFLLASENAHGAVRSGGTVSLRSTKLGKVLVNAKGRTLYLFAKDRNGRSSCTGACATNWPPLIVLTKPTAGTGVKTSLLGTTMRSDGRKQVTYNHHPLYTFAFDKQAGQTKGEGLNAFGAHWWGVSAKGNAVKNPSGGTTTGTTTTTPYPTTTTRYP